MSVIEEAAEDALTAAAPPMGIAIKVGRWIAANALPILLAVCALWLVGHLLLGEWKAAQVAKTEATVTANVASATNASARDAVTTVEHNITNERNITNEVTHAQNAIAAAPDGAAVDAAGSAGLCAVAAGFCPSSTVQQPHPR